MFAFQKRTYTYPSWLLLFLLSLATNLLSQSLPVAIDSRFDDWSPVQTILSDPANDGSSIDFRKISVSNDHTYLFFKLEIENEINLTEANEITLYMDTDLNAATGQPINGTGVDLIVRPGEREAFYTLPNGSGLLSLNDIRFRHQPTVSDHTFELAISRYAVSNAGTPLFQNEGIRFFWRDEKGSNGDEMPGNGDSFTYLFDESPVSDPEPVLLEKEGQGLVRILTWNTLNSGLDDVQREPYFKKILSVLEPDIITFNECWNLDAPQVASFMNAALPLGNFQSWKAVKLDPGNVTASRFPILQSWNVFPGHRLTASLIDVPAEVSASDLLVVNSHFKCCSNGDFDRQREADAFASFIRDAKNPGGELTLPENTPFILSGDLNLVGDRQQLTTLLTGDIVNTGQFGPGTPLDWDGSELEDVIGLHTNERVAYTWRNDFSSFPPSRIDYHIISNSVASVEKTYVLETRSMSPAQLVLYGLSSFDIANASDHLPKVTDLRLSQPVATNAVTGESRHMQLFPNPASQLLNIRFSTDSTGDCRFTLQNSRGSVLKTWSANYPAGDHRVEMNLNDLAPGIYFMSISSREKISRKKFLIIQE